MKCGTFESHPSVARIDPATPIINHSKRRIRRSYLFGPVCSFQELLEINRKNGACVALFYINEYLMNVIICKL